MGDAKKCELRQNIPKCLCAQKQLQNAALRDVTSIIVLKCPSYFLLKMSEIPKQMCQH